ncbi:hypothetical protein GXW82_39960 [Streptacidiphilus sp. 4-A2]|nr:hypothetical protein [Streptacidiphilus sp. 4-A2]
MAELMSARRRAYASLHRMGPGGAAAPGGGAPRGHHRPGTAGGGRLHGRPGRRAVDAAAGG